MNYEGHIREMGHEMPAEPLIFLKAPSTVVGPGEHIVLPPESSRVDFEGELAVVIGKRFRRISRDQAKDHILGYTILNDVTARDLQRKDVQFSRGKSFDTFCPMGPWIETELDPGFVRITTVVNSEVRQDGQTSDMLFDPATLVEFISSVMTLMPGDVIATGTPAGVGPLSDGDEVSVAVEGIGVLTNTVVEESL
jgi:2-keto-4-pentenoate hydratase/2-oxohepta-3-ene-1,7-dioic acid hydratase in catechol pathway